MKAGGLIEADAVELSWAPAPDLLPAATVGFWHDVVPPATFVRQVSGWALVWFAVGGVAILLSALGYPPILALGGVVGAGVVMVALAVITNYRLRRFQNSLRGHWQDAGRTTARFDAMGVHVADGVSETKLVWQGIDGISAIRGGTLVRAGISIVVVPDGALPQDLTPEAFRDRLEGWRA